MDALNHSDELVRNLAKHTTVGSIHYKEKLDICDLIDVEADRKTDAVFSSWYGLYELELRMMLKRSIIRNDAGVQDWIDFNYPDVRGTWVEPLLKMREV